MSHSEDRHLDFVLRHYKEGAFDTQKAIGRFRESQGMRPVRRRLNFVRIGLSAAAAVLLGVFLFMNHRSGQWTEVTASSLQHGVVLPDGTDVTLTPGSSIRFRMKDVREVKMDGKVYFDVARDEARPFEIETDGAFVRVLGTEFMVDGSEESVVRVYVDEGKVLFARNRPIGALLCARNSKTEGVILTEGMAASLEDGDVMPVVDEDADTNAIAWQRGTFVFDQTPLKDVLDCLSDYYHVSFAANDLSKQLSGEFVTDDLDLIIELIESALDVTIIRR